MLAKWSKAGMCVRPVWETKINGPEVMGSTKCNFYVNSIYVNSVLLTHSYKSAKKIYMYI